MAVYTPTQSHTTGDPVRDLADTLNAKRVGDGKYSARCPAHDDRNASLSVTRGDDGRALVHCHAGCSTDAVLAEIGWTKADLFPPKHLSNGRAHANGSTKPTIIKTYDYRDETGEPVAQAVRMMPKSFRQRRPDGQGGWIWNMQGVDVPLYRIHEARDLMERMGHRLIFLCEGEKDVDRLFDLGWAATTNIGGAKGWKREHAEAFRDCIAVVLEDNDAAGRDRTARVGADLQGIAREVRVLRFPELPEHGDVSDWLDAGHDIAELMDRVDAAPVWTAEQPADDAPAEPLFKFHTASEFDALDLRREYHVPGILAAGPVPTILAGSFKTLKTSIGVDLLFSLATGTSFLAHFPTSGRVPVAVMSGESGGYALQNLLRRVAHSRGWTMGAVGDYLRICTAVLDLTRQRDIDVMERFIVEHGIRVLAIDPTYLAMRGMRADDAGSVFAMGAMLEPLSKLGERTGCTPLIVHHNSRGATRLNAGEPAELADIAWSGFAEWAGQWLLLSRRERYDPDSDGEHRLWLTAGGRDGHSALVGVDVTEGRSDDPGGRRWQVSVEQASSIRQASVTDEQERREQQRQARRDAQQQQDRETILGIMRTMPDGATKTDIRDRSGIRGERFNPVFADLLATRTVVPCTVAKGNGRQYEGYQIITRTHPDAPGQPTGVPLRTGEGASETDAPHIYGASRPGARSD